LILRTGSATAIGRVREHNEDSLLAEDGVFVVADGMGGHAAGEVASRIAVETLAELVTRTPRRPEDVLESIATANRRILESGAQHPEQTGMGTTATGVTVVSVDGSEQWLVFNVGDSRVYRLVAEQLALVTVDHSEVRELVDAGLITQEEAAWHPLRNVVTRSLGAERTPRPDTWVLAPEAGERFVVCSDGLSNELTDDQIREVLLAEREPQAAAERLVSEAVAAGGHDNVSVVVVAAEEGDTDVRQART
jgi:protein phosphatase